MSLAEPEVAQHTQRELLERMTRTGLSTAAFLAINAGAASYLLREHLSAVVLTTWLVAVLATIVNRILIFVAWRRVRSVPIAASHAWEWLLAACALFEGATWTALAYFPFGSDAELVYAVAIVIVSAAAIGVPFYGLSWLAGTLFLAPILVGEGLALSARSSDHLGPVVLAWISLSLVSVIALARTSRHYRDLLVERVVQRSSAARRRVLLDTLKSGVVITRDDLIEECNDNFLHIFGYERSELIGQDLRLLMPGAREIAEFEEHRASLHLASPLVRQVRRQRRDGTTIELQVNLGLVDPADLHSPVVGVYEDISERLRVERDLRFTRDRMRLALDALQSGVWDIDLQEDRHFYSRRFKSILGFPLERRLEPPLARLFFHHEMIDPRDAPVVAEARRSILVDGTPLDVQYRVKIQGSIVWIRESAIAVSDASGAAYRFTGSITDITEGKAISERLAGSEAFHRDLVAASNALIWRSDAQGVLTFASERGALELYGFEAAQMVGRPLADFLAPEASVPELHKMLAALARATSISNFETVHVTRSKRRIFLSINAVPVQDDGGHFQGAIGISSDITHLKRRERAFQEVTRLQRLIFNGAGEGIVLVRHHRIYRANQAFSDLLGVSVGEIVARPLSRWVVDEQRWEQTEAQLRMSGDVIKVEQQLRRADGSLVWASVTGRVAGRSEVEPIYIWVFADISATKAQEEQSWHSANHDELTGLPNRRLLQDRLEQTLARAARESMRMAIMVIDLDGFKKINDECGHQFGDEVLRQVARRLALHVRQLDTVARLGGDEFVIVLHQVASVSDIELLAARIIERIGEPIEFAGRSARAHASIGIALYPDHSEGLAGLMHAADLAMYAAKAAGKACYRMAETPPRRDRTRQDA